MPAWILRRSAPAIWRRVPWRKAWLVALWLFHKGRERVDANLDQRERSEFLHLIAKSKGRPANLAQGERTRIKTIAGKAIRG
jgi:hypothetical protein